jgi:uncharacterized membrane protein YdjX (TVP38/TMEM64 family)
MSLDATTTPAPPAPTARARLAARARSLPSTRAAAVRIGALVLLLVGASLIGYELGWFDYRHTLEHITRLRAHHNVLVFSVGFVLVYGLGTSIGLPGLPFTVAAGVIFGTVLGSTVSWFAELVSAAAGYWIALTVGHDVVLRWLSRYRKVNAAIEDARDFAGILRLRFIPVLPLGTVNFVCGLARAPFARYMLATAIGVIPSTIIYTYFADSLLERVGHGHSDALRSVIIASVLLILLSLTPRWMNRTRRGIIKRGHEKD